MKTIEAQPAAMICANDPVGQLKNMHASLLQRHRPEGETVTLLNDVEAFIRQGQRAGTVCTREKADRWEIQGILDFWVATRDWPDVYHQRRRSSP